MATMDGEPVQPRLDALQQQARELPDAPGVYLFKDEQERVTSAARTFTAS